MQGKYDNTKYKFLLLIWLSSLQYLTSGFLLEFYFSFCLPLFPLSPILPSTLFLFFFLPPSLPSSFPSFFLSHFSSLSFLCDIFLISFSFLFAHVFLLMLLAFFPHNLLYCFLPNNQTPLSLVASNIVVLFYTDFF